MTTSIQARIARILRRHFLVRPRCFRPWQRLEQDYNLGLLERRELALCLEQQFQLDFYDQEVAEFSTFSSVVALVKRHIQASPVPVAARLRPVSARTRRAAVV